MSSYIRASVIARRMLQARGLTPEQARKAMIGVSLGSVMLRPRTIAADWYGDDVWASDEAFLDCLVEATFGAGAVAELAEKA